MKEKKQLLTETELSKLKEQVLEDRLNGRRPESRSTDYVRLKKYNYKRKDGASYYLQIGSEKGKKRKIPFSSKREANATRQYLLDTIFSKDTSGIIRGRAKISKEQSQFYFNERFIDTLDHLYKELVIDGVQFGKHKKSKQPLSEGSVKRFTSGLQGVRKAMAKENYTLLEFFQDYKVTEYLRKLYQEFKNKDQVKAWAMKEFFGSLYHFEDWLRSRAMKQIHERAKVDVKFDIDAELLYLRKHPLISESVKEEIRDFITGALPTSEKTEEYDHVDPAVFIRELELALDKAKTIPDIQTILAILVNEALCFRQNEFCALKFSDFGKTKEGLYEVRKFKKAVVQRTGHPRKIVPTNKNNYSHNKNKVLPRKFGRYLELLRHPIFSKEFPKYYNVCRVKLTGTWRIGTRKTGRSTGFKSYACKTDISLFQFLLDGGFDHVENQIGERVKKEFLLEVTNSSTPLRFQAAGAFREAHKRICKRYGIEYKPPHQRFRSDPVTQKLIDEGNSLESRDEIQSFMGWKTASMIDTYTNKLKETQRKKTLLSSKDHGDQIGSGTTDYDKLSREELIKLLQDKKPK